jgi:murein DD-endopeptidase MepM/ murein hydrolase activator NlpD
MKTKKRVLSIILAIAVFFGCTTLYPMQGAQAVTQSDIDALKEQSSALDDQISGIQSEIDELNFQETKTLAQKALYDEQCALISQQIENSEAQIADYEQLIVEAQEDLEEAVAAEDAQHELMCERIRAMEERGTISYFEILFDAKDFGDLLSRLDFIFEIMNYDESVIEDYQALQQETVERQNALNDLLDETQEAKTALEAQKATLDQQLAEAEALVKEIQSNQEEYAALMEQLADEEAELNDQIAKAEAEYAEQIRQQQEAAQAAQNSGSSGGSGSVSGGGNSAAGISFAWPCASQSITSYFGYRSSSATNGVGSTNHMGIDIGGVGYSTPIVAAAAGVVTISMYSSSAGNYVAVSHGNGVVTQYMHMSSRSVSVGDSVSQGQQLGISGSTGNSTGPHLHFGVMINGSYVDPLDYLP